MMIFSLSRGETTVLEVAPAKPPAIKYSMRCWRKLKGGEMVSVLVGRLNKYIDGPNLSIQKQASPVGRCAGV